MRDLLLTHGYFLLEDPKERVIMKPYAPLGILYLCSHLRSKGFAVDVFVTTFFSKADFIKFLQTCNRSNHLSPESNIAVMHQSIRDIRSVMMAAYHEVEK